MASKLATLGLLKIKVFWNKGYDIMIITHDVPHKLLSGVSVYVVDVVMWPEFDNSSITMRKVITTPIL